MAEVCAQDITCVITFTTIIRAEPRDELSGVALQKLKLPIFNPPMALRGPKGATGGNLAHELGTRAEINPTPNSGDVSDYGQPLARVALKVGKLLLMGWQ